MAREGILSPEYPANNMPSRRLESLTDGIDNQLKLTGYKKEIPYMPTPDQGAVPANPPRYVLQP